MAFKIGMQILFLANKQFLTMDQGKHFENNTALKDESPDFFVQQFFLACISDFSYYIESHGEAAILDPIRDIEQYLDFAKSRNAKIKYVLETHLHADFVSGHVDIAKATGATIVYGPTAEPSFAIKQAKDGELLPLGKVHIRVDHTPGHTMESSCYVLVHDGKDHCVFTGDTLFLGEVGRPDLAVKTGEITVEQLAGLLYDSLRNKIMKYHDDMIIYPGHGAGSSCGKAIGAGQSCTIGKQKKNNYALQEMTREEFTQKVLEGMPKPPAYFFHDAKLNKAGPADIQELIKNKQKPLTYEQFSEYVKKGAIILDTRPSVEEGIIEGAYNMSFSSPMVNFVGSLLKPETQIVVVATPGQANDSVLRLLRIGYDNVMGYLQGGFEVYKANGGTVATTVKRVSLTEFFEDKEKPDHVFLDVRNPPEWAQGFIEGSLRVALSELQNSLDQVPKGKTVHVYCKTGGRAKMAMSILLRNGYKNVVITEEGGFDKFVERGLGTVQKP